MKQLAQYQDGRLELQDVPLPTPPPGGALVRVTHSVISAGTEKMKVEQAKMSLLRKAKARPDQVRKVLDTARTLGWHAALEKVRNRLETPTPLGYSAAGVVQVVDPANTRLRVGDRVACGGAECAFHAEFIAVPDMLAAKVPDGVENWQAAYTTIASIALQAVRQAEPTLGERVLVIGQGLVGLLITALLRTDGARVMALDLAKGRRPFAEAMGAERFLTADQSLADEVRSWTDGYGADAVILATATHSNLPTEQAIDVLRDRGRLVVVGNTKVDLLWQYAYQKEVEVRYTRSYGPGRYDHAYEWGGVDYPIGYVRWTEQRNFEATLHLMQTGALNLAPITTRWVPFGRALQVYHELLRPESQDVGVVLHYEPAAVPPDHPTVPRRDTGLGPPAGSGSLRLTVPVSHLDVIGGGNFVRTMLLPHLRGQVPFGTIVNHTALSAGHVKTKFGFAAAATDFLGILGENLGSATGGATRGPAAVLIGTRHHLHAPIVLHALAADRHVFVEKPLCLNPTELATIDAALARSAGSVLVGFNRRFAPASRELKGLLQSTPGPKVASFRVVPGRLQPDHWYANYAESGGRIVGEGCHFLDYFCFLFDAKPVRVLAQPTGPHQGRLPFPDSVAAQVEFAEGSCGQLIYTAEGDATWPKEQCTVYGAGFVAELTNFEQLVIHRGRRRTRRSFSGKGHREEMAAWAGFLRGSAEHPMPYDQARQSMQLTFAVLESIQQGHCVLLEVGVS